MNKYEQIKGMANPNRGSLGVQEARPPQRTEQPAPVQHPDDAAVDSFAAAMKDKLAKAREKGRSGWETCQPEDLSRMLREHVDKGDPRDVANFSMMLWRLSAAISPQPARQVVDSEEKAGAYMEARLWEFIDMAAAWPKTSPDPRTWDHVMVYAPKPAQQEPAMNERELLKMRNAATALREALAQQKPLPKGEWPKHPSPYVNDQYRGYLKSDLDDYAMQVLTAHNIKEKNT